MGTKKMAGDRVTCETQQWRKQRCVRNGYLGSLHQNVKKKRALATWDRAGQTGEKFFWSLIRRSSDTNSMIALDGFRQLRIE